jgi:hypothetical protein
MVGTTADPGNVDIVCSIMPLASTFYAALSTIPIFPPVALCSAMPTSPLMMAPNMKVAMARKRVGFDRKRDCQLARLPVPSL